MCYHPSPVLPDLCFISSGLFAWKNTSEASACFAAGSSVAGGRACAYSLDPSALEPDKAGLLARVNNADGLYTDYFGGVTGLLNPAGHWGDITWVEPDADANVTVAPMTVASDVGGVKMYWVVDTEAMDAEVRSRARDALAFDGGSS